MRAGRIRLVQDRSQFEPEGRRGSLACEDCSTRVPRSGRMLHVPNHQGRGTSARHQDPPFALGLDRIGSDQPPTPSAGEPLRQSLPLSGRRHRGHLPATLSHRTLGHWALVTLVKMRLPASALDRILYFHAAKADRLLHDVVSEILGPMSAEGLSDISVMRSRRPSPDGSRKARQPRRGTRDTTCRVTQGLMSALRDFGVLQGAVHKRIAPAYLPVKLSPT